MKNADVRKPAVAGKFYPSSKEKLKDQIDAFVGEKSEKSNVLACVLPHAGYIFSGMVAAQTLASVNIKNKVILLGPNHTGYGGAFSIMTKGRWQTPLGEVEIDSELAGRILNKSRYLKDDSLAHLYEHSLEVELPILQYFKTGFKIVPIAVLSDDIAILKEIGAAIASVIRESNIKDSVMLLASSDMTHYESQGEAKKKDAEAIKAILKLNEDLLMEKIDKLNISMCGYAAVIVMLSAAKLLGADSAKLIKYQTSGDVTGDNSSVVGYAGIVIS